MRTLVCITDGRWSYLARTLTSAREHLGFDRFDRRILVNDSTETITLHLDGWETIHHAERRGLAASVNTAWQAAAGSDWVFHLEEDWTFDQLVDVGRMAAVLAEHPELAQMVLRRQPMPVPDEDPETGFIGAHPDAYADRRNQRGDQWLEHDRCFSLNPCLIPGRICELGWPDHGNEGDFTRRLTDLGLRFAIWGGRSDQPRVHHIGEARTPAWQL